MLKLLLSNIYVTKLDLKKMLDRGPVCFFEELRGINCVDDYIWEASNKNPETECKCMSGIERGVNFVDL